MESEENTDKDKDKESSSITKRSLMAIRQMGRNTAMILRKEEVPIPVGELGLKDVTRENFWDICNLKVSLSQEEYVAANVVSIAEAYFSKTAWLRAIYLGSTPIGFIMLSKDTVHQKYILWRIMIDEKYQRKGFGRQAFQKLMDEVKAFPGANELTTSYVTGKGSPKDFFVKMKFVHTGKKIGNEVCLTYYANAK